MAEIGIIFMPAFYHFKYLHYSVAGQMTKAGRSVCACAWLCERVSETQSSIAMSKEYKVLNKIILSPRAGKFTQIVYLCRVSALIVCLVYD